MIELSHCAPELRIQVSRELTECCLCQDVLRFWLDRGVDGVRVDAVRALHEDRLLRDNSFREDGTMTTEHTKNLPESYDVVYQFRSVVDEYPDR